MCAIFLYIAINLYHIFPQSAETRMSVSGGRLLSKNQFGSNVGQQLLYLRTVNADLLDDFARGVAVNTNYLSDIKVKEMEVAEKSQFCSRVIWNCFKSNI